MWEYDFNKTAASYLSQDHHDVFADVDRVVSDRLECYVQLRGSVTGYDVSFQVNAAQLGIASYVQYWHYRDEELQLAKTTFNELKKISKTLVEQVEYEKIPFSNIGPMSRSALCYIDQDHKEKSGVEMFNKALKTYTEPDWRKTIYGKRYPGHDLQNQSGETFNTMDAAKKLTSTGDGRNKQYKLIVNRDKI